MHDYTVAYWIVNPEDESEKRSGTVSVQAPSRSEAERIALRELQACYTETVVIDRIWPTAIRWTN